MDRHIKEVLNQYLHEGKISSGFTAERIRKVWGEMMGPSVEKHTRKVKYKKGELSIAIDSSVLKYELIQNSSKIIDRLNEAIGSEAVKDIRFC